jgi:hypothetical protein
MTISAFDRADDSDLLDRTLEVYRDLTVALRDRITLLKAGIGGKCKDLGDDVKEHAKLLRTVLDIEARLGKRYLRAGGVELDLEAARGEIAARVAVWLARG